jgi:predicted Zn finger-like uncharacterized protein
MKIVCDACQAKYSISDDKVQGKVFKIRCKKCSNIIVVRGGAAEAAAPAPAAEKDTRVYDYGYEGGQQAPAADESVWHVVINQDQVGPMTAQEVQQRFESGEIDAETYTWREGFADWLPLAQVDAFASLASSGVSTAIAGGNGSAGAAAVASMFGGGGEEAGTVRSDPGDLFAAASARSSADDDGGDLFGSKPMAAAAPAAQSAAASKLRGERNENSVLFSLNNLAQLASDKPAPMAASAPSQSTMAGHATGAAGGEGSGLIDIRSMASAYLGGGGPGAAKPAAAAVGSIDDLPVFGGGGFSEPAVIVPQVSRGGNSKLMYALIGSVGLLAVAAVILVIVLLGRGGDKDKDTVASGTDKPDVAKPDDTKKPDEAKPDDTKKPDDTAAKPDDTSRSKPPADDTTKADAAALKKDPPKKDPPRKDPPRRDVVAVKDPPKKDPPKKDPPTKAGECDQVSCVVSGFEGACCAKFKTGGKTGGTAEKPKSDVPDQLDKSMISAGVAAVKGRAIACGNKSAAKGIVKVGVKVNPDGSVASVSVKDTPDGALGTCVAGAMRSARFARTQTGGSFSYPFMF